MTWLYLTGTCIGAALLIQYFCSSRLQHMKEGVARKNAALRSLRQEGQRLEEQGNSLQNQQVALTNSLRRLRSDIRRLGDQLKEKGLSVPEPDFPLEEPDKGSEPDK
jgi:hypothetical protein